MKNYLYIFCLILLPSICSSQKFQGTYGTAQDDAFNSVIELPDGNFLAAGHSSGFTGGGDDLIFYKISVNGEFLEQKALGGTGSETIEELTLLDNGNIAFLGYSNSFSQAGDFNLFYGVLSQDLEVIWCKQTTNTGSESARDLKILSDQNLLITGAGNGYGTDGTQDIFVIKSDLEGEIIWSKAFGLTDYEVSLSCAEDIAGNLYIWGHCLSEFTQQYDGLLMQINPDGELNWTKIFAGVNNELAGGAIAHPDGGVLVTGDTSSFGAGLIDCFVMHVDVDGTVIWSNAYGSDLHEHGTALSFHGNESFFVGGLSGSFGGGGLDMLSLLIDLEGILKYGQAYGGPIKETCYDVHSCSDGGAIFAGYSRSYGEGFNSGFLTKLDINGASGCAQAYGHVLETNTFEFEQSNTNMELKTENINVEDLEMDEVVTSYVHAAYVCEINYLTEMEDNEQNPNSNPFNEEDLPTLEAADFESKMLLYPNPTAGDVWLEITTEKDETLDLAVLDVNGRTLWSNRMLLEGKWMHKLNIPLHDLESGVYFVSIETTENQSIKRLIVDHYND